ncbi:nuclear transport factor 2 family protein [Roseibium sp.]|uniref:nuclear transport factor 2 family protein n=1 Tax=Roseibium sp. TaxID=1936156 RepID=UPI003D09DC2D
MKITTTTGNSNRPLLAALYSAVDAFDAEAVGALLTRDVGFQLGNFGEISGKQAVIDANRAFFETIAAMRHTITGIWSEDRTVICAGTVHYTRKDGTELEVPFATVLELSSGQIRDYRVFVDISAL